MPRRLKLVFLFASIVTYALAMPLRAQLAITEVMSSASTNAGPTAVTQNSDFWELTNFGTQTMDLSGYKFDDSDNNLAAADPTPFVGLKIGPGESIVFVQNNVNTNDVAFRAWWGTNLPAHLQVVFYNGNGLSSAGDGLRLWGPNAVDPADIVDRVDFPEATRGSTFTYDPITGEFGSLSTNQLGGAFKAATTDDVGSPGRTTGPTPLTIVQQPTDVIANPGDTASFSVKIQGRPRGALQWYFQDQPLPGATSATLQVTNTQAAVAGRYYVVAENGVSNVKSKIAQLFLQSELSAPFFSVTPASIEMYAGQTATFQATASGVPQPAYQWQKNGQDLPGAQSAQWTLAGATEQDSGAYTIVARNTVGATTNAFQVTVTAKPQLVVSEVMANASTNGPPHPDWWELSNLGNFPVHLQGYRFDDSSETLAAAFTITNDVIIASGESVVFVEITTPDAFREWWGPEFLSPTLQIITYRGNGLSSLGDAVNLWNAAATEDSDKVASAVFSTATLGVSFRYNPDSGQFGDLSVAGEQGAFAAVVSGDVGSPGYLRNDQRVYRPKLTGIVAGAATIRLTWSSQPGTTYIVQASPELSATPWTTLQSVTATQSVTSVDQVTTASVSHQYYRVAIQP